MDKGHNAPATGRPNTVNLAKRELDQFLDHLDASGQKGAEVKRQFVRWAFRQVSVRMEVIHSTGGTSAVRVACRNLSSGGMAVLHNAYTHPGSECRMHLQHPTKGEVPVPGLVVRCTHVRGMVHELGVRFAAPINAREFVRLDPMADCFSLEKVDVEKLRGSILYVDDSPMDLKLVQHYLRGTQVRLRTASDANAGLAIAEEGVDLILTDFDLPELDGVGFMERLRERGIETPIVMVTSDPAMLARCQASQVKAGAFLPKPLRQEVLLRALAEFLMGSNPGGGTATSSLPPDHPNIVLVDGFIDHLRKDAKRLVGAIEREDAGVCRSIALQIAGVAPAMGFEHLGRIADDAQKAISASASVAESMQKIRALLMACQAARAA